MWVIEVICDRVKYYMTADRNLIFPTAPLMARSSTLDNIEIIRHELNYLQVVDRYPRPRLHDRITNLVITRGKIGVVFKGIFSPTRTFDANGSLGVDAIQLAKESDVNACAALLRSRKMHLLTPALSLVRELAMVGAEDTMAILERA